MDEKFEKLIAKIKGFNPNPNLELISKAWEFAKIAHYGQKRLSGDETITHPLEVADILSDWKLDSVSIAAGLLHDTVEDCGIKKKELADEFGEDVAELVDGVTNIGKIKLRGSKDEEFVENLRKMLLYMAKDLRVVFLRLADRLHNMRTLEFLPIEKQVRIVRETLQVFAPLAERLGIGEVKSELEDLAFPYVYPDEYKKVIEKSKIHYKKAGEHLKKMKRRLLKKLAEEKIKAKIYSRKKHLYSLWRKLDRPEIKWDFAEVYDIVALRILVENVEQCYAALGIVHTLYKPVPYIGISDFIAQPKPNGYRSIHTKVLGPGGRATEVQITTRNMHEENEYGLAAHWHYSLKKSGKANEKIIERGFFAPTEKIKWVKQLVEWQKTETDSEKFLESVKLDALNERIFVFSPKGDVYDLPVGASPVDFAASVHTDFLKFLKGAKVDGKVAPLNYKLKSGQLVEILKTKEERKPNPDWLQFVVTNLARGEIEKYLRKEGMKS